MADVEKLKREGVKNHVSDAVSSATTKVLNGSCKTQFHCIVPFLQKRKLPSFCFTSKAPTKADPASLHYATIFCSSIGKNRGYPGLPDGIFSNQKSKFG
jgi:hypothetical protein